MEENTIQSVKPTESYIQKTTSLIDNYISHSEWRIKENSNSSYSIQGLYDHIIQFNNALYWLNNVYDKEIKEAHQKGDFHIHDLGYLTGYCMGWDLEQLLVKGFGGVPGKITSRPPKHFAAALGQIWNFFYTLQGESAGAQAFSSFDTYLAPFVRHDNLTYEQVKQLMEEFVYNMNVPTRAGFQTPFTNITLDLQCPETLKNKPSIIGGLPQSETYGEFQKEMNMINRAFCEVMEKGDAAQKMFTFPIPTYNITNEFEWDNPEYEPIWKMTAKYGIPYFANFCGSDMKPSDVRSLCCRLRISTKELRRRGGGLFGANPMTGSIGVVTINMPRLGYLSKTKKEFYERLDNLMDIAARSLIKKREVVERNMESNLYPYSKYYLAETKKRTGSYFYNHFNTIGLLGMNECCLNLLNKDITTQAGLEFSKEVLNHMRERLIMYQESFKTPFNLEASPSEGTCVSLSNSLQTNRGTLTVKDILQLPEEKRKNIKILSLNERTLENEFKPLKDIWMTRRNANVMKITLDNDDIITITPDHKICVMKNGSIDYVESGTLKIGDMLYGTQNINGHTYKITDIQFPDYFEDVYDLEVEDNHNFFICGSSDYEEGVLVHNCYRLAKHDSEKYKNIITAGSKEAPYYTNSTNIPAKSLGDIFDDFKHQEQLQSLYTGGCVFHIYAGDYVEDHESVKLLIKQLCNNFKVPYISFTPTFSICPEHGIIPGVHETCPYCTETESEQPEEA